MFGFIYKCTYNITQNRPFTITKKTEELLCLQHPLSFVNTRLVFRGNVTNDRQAAKQK
uniref:Uncharacterized protein n=1 Tax=Anguilla anguilla TaxID=7936 RepID=A0A0E9X1L4_ANGAN